MWLSVYECKACLCSCECECMNSNVHVGVQGVVQCGMCKIRDCMCKCVWACVCTVIVCVYTHVCVYVRGLHEKAWLCSIIKVISNSLIDSVECGLSPSADPRRHVIVDYMVHYSSARNACNTKKSTISATKPQLTHRSSFLNPGGTSALDKMRNQLTQQASTVGSAKSNWLWTQVLRSFGR